jgi:hypothetical protein
MSGYLSKEGHELHHKILEAGGIGMDSDVFRDPVPKIEIWKIISDAARSIDKEPFNEAVKKFMISGHWGKYGTLWPAALYETANDLPGVSREEALAICQQFMSAERLAGLRGNLIYLLHWDVLAAFYCPLREQYSALREMVGQQFLSEASAGQAEARSHLKWPLLLTEAGKLEIKKALWRHRLRSSFLSKIEAFFDGLWQNYPRIITFLAAMLGAGVLIEIAKWLFKLLP